MHGVLIYSTKYHIDQVELIKTPLLEKFRIGFKHQSPILRGLNLFRCLLQLATTFSRSRIYVPRSNAKDNWIVYVLFKRRCTLISDGLSDHIEVLPVVDTGWLNLGFKSPVEPLFHVSQRRFQKRPIFFDAGGPIAIYDKRGRDPEYVAHYVREATGAEPVVNPQSGSFSLVFSAPSTVLFELPDEIKPHLIVVSQSHCSSLGAKRRIILEQYEKILSDHGYRVL